MSQRPQAAPAKAGSSSVLATAKNSGYDVSLVGDLDTATSAEVVEALISAIDRNVGEELLIDVSGVTFLDSSGLSALVTARNHASARGKRVLLVEVPARVRTVLNITGLNQVFLA